MRQTSCFFVFHLSLSGNYPKKKIDNLLSGCKYKDVFVHSQYIQGGMKMSRGMITGELYGSWGDRQTQAVSGNNRKKTDRTFADESNTSGQADLYSDNVQYDVSEGRSRVAQILLQDMAIQMDSGQQTEDVQEEDKDNEKDSETDTTGYSESDIEYMERLLESMKKSRENQQKSRTNTKRVLNYNFRKVSGAIMRAKTRMQAGNALSSAKTELSGLKRKAGSGQYKDEDIRIAISHANKMIRTARKKMSHIKLEEIRKKSDRDLFDQKEKKGEEIKKQEIHRDNPAVKAEVDQKLLQLKKKLKKLSEAEKNGHRRTENYDLLQADMEYLKKKIDQLKHGTQDNSTNAAVSVNGSGEVSFVAGDTTAGTSTDTEKTADAAGSSDPGMSGTEQKGMP